MVHARSRRAPCTRLQSIISPGSCFRGGAQQCSMHASRKRVPPCALGGEQHRAGDGALTMLFAVCALRCCRLNSFLDHVDVGEYIVEGDLEAYSCE